jgi:hypothetical protein
MNETETKPSLRPPFRPPNPANPRRITPEKLLSLDKSLKTLGDLTLDGVPGPDAGTAVQ